MNNAFLQQQEPAVLVEILQDAYHAMGEEFEVRRSVVVGCAVPSPDQEVNAWTSSSPAPMGLSGQP